MLNLSYENQLLHCSTRTEISEDTRAKVKELLKGTINWDEIWTSASWHGIGPLLYNSLKSFQETDSIPVEFMEKLKAAYYDTVARNMFLYAELERILEAFDNGGIEVIILKGAALAQTVYGDIGLRPMSDIDLLVKKQALPDAERILYGAGYFLDERETSGWYQRNRHHHMNYIHREKRVPVEVHWHIANKIHPSRIRDFDNEMIAKWRKEAMVVTISGLPAQILSPEDCIFHLCLHFLKHRYQNRYQGFGAGFTSRGALIQLHDIFQTIRYFHDKICGERLRHKAEQYGIADPVFMTLCIVGKILGENDDTIRKTVDCVAPEGRDRELVSIMCRKILRREDSHSVVPSKIIQLQAAHTCREKAGILRNYIFPDPGFISERYSVPLSSTRLYLYYMAHPFILLLRYGRIVLEVSRIKEDVILKRWMSGK
ncbi:MAG: nucleotidyltransferase family protein [Candidatus Scalindua sp.]|nr:nucleotidyltransferase family protein [Candidatus Scalindua sp.]